MAIGGVIEARVTVWAAEAHQSEHVVKYPDVVVAAARFELDALNRVTEREVVQEFEKAHYASWPKDAKGQRIRSWREKLPLLVPPEFKTLGPKSWIFRGGPHLSELAPGTALEQEAKALLADPVEIVRQRRQKQFDYLTQASAAKQQWSGTWAFQTPLWSPGMAPFAR